MEVVLLQDSLVLSLLDRYRAKRDDAKYSSNQTNPHK
jgi:hypothetical protein